MFHLEQNSTTKLLFKGERNQLIETVVMRYDGRTKVCVSSQVGCKLACAFCQTGKLGFFRNLSVGEILQQIFIADLILKPEGRRVTNVVFMGMGEPLDDGREFNALFASIPFSQTRCQPSSVAPTSRLFWRIVPVPHRFFPTAHHGAVIFAC